MFNNFPLIAYTFNEDKNTDEYKLVTNILARFKLRRNFVEDSTFFYSYEIQDFETPDILASQIYGNPNLHWLVLVANDIRDPYNEWPKEQNTLNAYIQKKYRGQSLFMVTDTSTVGVPLTNPDGSVGDVPVAGALDFEKGDIITNNSGATGTVKHWDITYRRLDIITTHGTFAATDNIENVTKPGSVARGQVGRYVAVASSALKHFRAYDKTFVNPYSVDPENTGRYRIDRYIDGNNSEIFTFENYELEENEKKRKIKLIRPELAPQIQSELEGMF